MFQTKFARIVRVVGQQAHVCSDAPNLKVVLKLENRKACRRFTGVCTSQLCTLRLARSGRIAAALSCAFHTQLLWAPQDRLNGSIRRGRAAGQ
jgi:hypothetical protein